MWKQLPGGRGDDAWVGHDASEHFPVYTRGNAGEVYPEVFTPLTYSIAAEAGERAMRGAILTSGLIRPSELEKIPITTAIGSGVFGGYAYLNLSVFRLLSARSPGAKAEDADVNFLGGGGDAPPHIPLPFERNRRATLAGIRYIVKTIRRRELPELEQDKRRVDAFLEKLADPKTATDAQLRDSVDDTMEIFPDLFERHLVVSFAAGLTVTALTTTCEQQFDDPLLAVQLLAGLGDVDSAAPSEAMWQLSRAVNASPVITEAFDAGVYQALQTVETAAQSDESCRAFIEQFRTFIGRFGSRGPNEWDTAFDTWETNPTMALTMVDTMRAVADDNNPADRQAKLAQDADALRQELAGRLSRPLRAVFNRILDSARLHSRSRERSKTTVVRAIHGSRLQSKELDRRLVERSGGTLGDLWFILASEIDAYVADPGSFSETIAGRRATHRTLHERVPPFFFEGRQPPLGEWELKSEGREALATGESLIGLPGCPGVATGTARVVTDPADPRGLGPGDVLVAPLTDPAWTPLFLAAQAVVVDVGAVMSHAVIVSRELGIPCVVSATDATKRIADGTRIEVDGSKGTVRVLD